jgi:hypothetical protein
MHALLASAVIGRNYRLSLLLLTAAGLKTERTLWSRHMRRPSIGKGQPRSVCVHVNLSVVDESLRVWRVVLDV